MSTKDDLDNHSNQLNPNNDAYWQSRGFDEKPDWDDLLSNSQNSDTVTDYDDDDDFYDTSSDQNVANEEITSEPNPNIEKLNSNPALFFYDNCAIIIPHIKRIHKPSETENTVNYYEKKIHFYVSVDTTKFIFDVSGKKPNNYHEYCEGKLREEMLKIKEQIEQIEQNEKAEQAEEQVAKRTSYYGYTNYYDSNEFKKGSLQKDLKNLESRIEECKQFESDYRAGKEKAEKFYRSLLIAIEKFWALHLGSPQNP